MTTGFIILICTVIIISFFMEITMPRGGPNIQSPPTGPPPDDPPSE